MYSEIRQFYSNSNVLITGGTGFLGKVLIQKLVRECEDIGSIYLLIRPKREKTIDERCKAIFDDIIFDEMKRKVPNFLTKIVPIEGDTSQIALGIEKVQRDRIINQVNIVFHSAACMSMDAKLKDAVATNVRGLGYLIDLCQEMINLKAMLFVSTAYSNCTHPVIEERFYEVPIPAETLIKFMEDVNDSTLDAITQGLVGEWPNTYCFTKAIAETLLNKRAKCLPAAVFRPTIVMPVYDEPLPGWTPNVFGPIGAMTATGLGILRVFPCKSNVRCDLVPVDFCINALICSAWDIGRKRSHVANGLELQPAIYNYSKGLEGSMTWGEFIKRGIEHDYPLKNVIWYTMLILISNIYLYNILWFLLHTIPGSLIDLYLYLSGKNPRMRKIYNKASKFCEVLKYFTFNEYKIINRNIANLWNSLNEKDRESFPFDLNQIDYYKAVKDTCLGIKLYVLKEDLNNVENEKRRYKKFFIAHTVVKYLLMITTIVIVYGIVRMFCKFLSVHI
ncbi:hypothetical protein RI129_001798 [Pyrocoelia pectoralis]|uniref:Fatty acyl-CoA reductase n=1 Tax=Pyrocoelia pectoralis TaxID=417401 RepID=A0AAN7VVC7_9COLE